MGQTVYVDLFFMINFSMDFLCFYLTARLLSDKMSLPRVILAAALGGIYANLALFLPAEGMLAVLSDVCVCVLMCVLAFFKNGSLVTHTLVFAAVSAVLGGFMTAAFELLNRLELPLESLSGDGISAWLLALLAALGGILSLLGGRFFRRRSSKRYVSVTVELLGKKKTLSAFCDSGNLLREPISGKPCILADADALSAMLPADVAHLLRDGARPESIGGDMARRIRLVPTKSAVGEGMLVALRADRVALSDNGEEREVDAFVVLCELGRGAEGCYALVPTEILT